MPRVFAAFTGFWPTVRWRCKSFGNGSGATTMAPLWQVYYGWSGAPFQRSLVSAHNSVAPLVNFQTKVMNLEPCSRPQQGLTAL